MKGRNKKGFTLVELLASLVILGLLTAIAAPNIFGILSSTKVETYITDANKLRTLAEYKLRSGSDIERPAKDQCILMTMNYLGTSEFKKPPYGGTYEPKKSYVIVCRENVTINGTTTEKYVYYTQLIEKVYKTKDVESSAYLSGFKLRKTEDIKSEYVQSNMTTSSISEATTSMAAPKTEDNKQLATLVQRYV